MSDVDDDIIDREASPAELARVPTRGPGQTNAFDPERTSNFQGASRPGTISFRFGLPSHGAAIVDQF
jgi:hypothetical protein